MPNIVHLAGCAPTPLAHYLKALGILRLVAEQKDENACGYWQGEHFVSCL
jgi:CRISPR-associated protein Csx17